MDPADHAGRAQGLRGAPGHHPAQGRPARRVQGPCHVEGAAHRRGRGPGSGPRSLRSRVGGGQGGIALGARLRQLGIDHLVVDRHPRPGDQWRSRYKSLCLHDPVWYDHLPYLPFPPNWPIFAPKDKIGDWLEMYTRIMEINYWGSTTAATPRGTTRRRNGRSPSTGRARRSCCTPSSSSSPSACRASPTSLRSPGRTCSPASSTTAPSTRGRTTTRTRGSSSSARTTRRSTSAVRCGRSAPT